MQKALSPHSSVISSMKRVFPDPLAPMMVMRRMLSPSGSLTACSDFGNRMVFSEEVVFNTLEFWFDLVNLNIFS